ncbi:hypothetical protein [Neisseria meningitidis]|nr:hypothetical protein [Neisseria meningitidis]
MPSEAFQTAFAAFGHLKPAQEGIRIHLHRNLHPVIPAKAGI